MTREIEYEESQDSPWATGASMSHIDWVCPYEDGPWATDGWRINARWNWNRYPHNEVVAPPREAEREQPIRIEPLKQGFLVKCRCVAERAFTDRVDAAEWLLGWLGFGEEIVEGVLDALDGPWDADELYNILSDCVAGVDYDELEDRDCAVAHVALAAWAYIEAQGLDAQEKQYQKLVEAVKKWRIDDPELKRPPMPSRALDVAGWAWLYIKSGDERDLARLAEAVKRWRGIDGEEVGEAAKRRRGLT